MSFENPDTEFLNGPDNWCFKPVSLFRIGRCDDVHSVAYGGGLGGGGGPQQIPETPLEKEAAAIAEERFDYYEQNYRPIEAEFRKEVDRMGSKGAYDFAEGAARSATMAEFGKAKQATMDNLHSRGINPNSGASKMTAASLADAEATAAGDTASRALNSQSDEHARGIMNVVAMGNNQATTAQQGLGGLADVSAGKAANDAWDAHNSRAATNYAAGQALGAAGSFAVNGLGSAPPRGPAGTNRSDYTSPQFQDWVANQG